MQGGGWEYHLYFKLQPIRRKRKIYHRVWQNLQQSTQHFRLHLHIRWAELERAEELIQAVSVSGLSILMVAYAIYLTYKACKARDCETLESSRDELCSRL